jgi:hypothetical protein
MYTTEPCSYVHLLYLDIMQFLMQTGRGRLYLKSTYRCIRLTVNLSRFFLWLVYNIYRALIMWNEDIEIKYCTL